MYLTSFDALLGGDDGEDDWLLEAQGFDLKRPKSSIEVSYLKFFSCDTKNTYKWTYTVIMS